MHAGAIVSAREKGQKEVRASLDLGRTEDTVEIRGETVIFPDGQTLGIGLVGKIEGGYCYLVRDSQLYRIQTFSPETNRVYTLVPTKTAPTFAISGIRMHQTKDHDPMQDAAMKVKVLRPMENRTVLDTCMGLGYSAIAALKAGALTVTTVEADRNVVELARVNPWSKELWADGRIRLIEGDIKQVISDLDDEGFDRIIHDPPRMAMAGELYGIEFYRQLHRVLKDGGILFHYVGRPGGRFRNRKVTKGVIERLREAGFSGIRRLDDAQGIKAFKER